MSKPVVHGYFVCWNEQEILPFFLDHYRWLDRLVIYDNESDDATASILDADPRVERRIFKTRGVNSLPTLTHIKNTVWKESRQTADFVLVADMDEFLFHPNINWLLSEMKRLEATILLPKGYQMLSARRPTTGTRLSESIQIGARDTVYDKCLLFDPNNIDQIRFSLGAHVCKPSGKIKYFSYPGLGLLHYRYLDPAFVFERNSKLVKRMDKADIEARLGTHHFRNLQQIVNDYEHLQKRASNVINQLEKDLSTYQAQSIRDDYDALLEVSKEQLSVGDLTAAYKTITDLVDRWPDDLNVGALNCILNARSGCSALSTQILVRRTAALSSHKQKSTSAFQELAQIFAELGYPNLQNLAMAFGKNNF